MSTKAQTDWEAFHRERAVASHPRWPMEAMVKLVFGDYLSRRIHLPQDAQVIDVGCGFGNNLLPFLDRQMKCCGVEIADSIAQVGRELLQARGHEADIRQGENRAIPFESDRFDLLLSLNVVHYEKNEADIMAALREYERVLKPGASMVLFTAGPDHDIYKRARTLGDHRYEISNWDFRDGQQYFYFDNLKYLNHYVSRVFDGVETARITERYPKLDLDFLVAVGRKRS